MDPVVVQRQAESAKELADTLLGWALPLASLGSAGLPSGAALQDLNAQERIAVLAAPIGGLVVAGVLMIDWALASRVASAWESGLGCTPNDARNIWTDTNLPDPGPIPEHIGDIP